MPPCHCNTHSCQGAIRARNTVAIHREDDRKMRSRQALTAYQQVLNQEEEEISAYISSITLAEPNAAEPSLDKLWAPPAQVMTDNCQRKSSTPLDDILHQLDAIESEIDALGVLAISQTEDLPMPTSRSDVFPLLGTQDAIKKLQNRIYGLSIPRTRMLHARQEEISGRLGTVIKTLSIAKITWKQRLNQLPDQEEDASQASLYDTGRYQCIAHFQRFSYLNRAPLFGFPGWSRSDGPADYVRNGRLRRRPERQPQRLPLPTFFCSISGAISFHEAYDRDLVK